MWRSLVCGKKSCGEALLSEYESRGEAILFEHESLGENMLSLRIMTMDKQISFCRQ
jgi:hypothetical protein